MNRLTISLTAGLRDMIASGRLTEDMIPDDFEWLTLAIEEAEYDFPESKGRQNFSRCFGLPPQGKRP